MLRSVCCRQFWSHTCPKNRNICFFTQGLPLVIIIISVEIFQLARARCHCLTVIVDTSQSETEHLSLHSQIFNAGSGTVIGFADFLTGWEDDSRVFGSLWCYVLFDLQKNQRLQCAKSLPGGTRKESMSVGTQAEEDFQSEARHKQVRPNKDRHSKLMFWKMEA